MDETQGRPRSAAETWRELVERDLKGAPFERKLHRPRYEGLSLKPLYTSEDWDGAGDPSGVPGAPPFTRGSRAAHEAPPGWSVLTLLRHPDPHQVARDAHLDSLGGADALLLRLDHTTRAGRPVWSSAEPADGVLLHDAADLAAALAEVPLDQVSVCLDAGASFLPAAAALAAVWAQRGIAAEDCRGAFDADPIGALAADGALPGGLGGALDALVCLGRATAATWPNVRAVGVNTLPWHDAGADAALELALGLSTGVTYLRVLTDGGLEPAAALGQMTVTVGLGTDLFLGVATLRAARTLWARVAEVCGAPGVMPRLRARVGRRQISRRDPWVNLLRGTAEGSAGALGGADEIVLLPFDEALGVPSERGRHLSRTTQLILREESHLGQVADPAGGSHYVEALTRRIEEASWSRFQEIEARGGVASCLLDGWALRAIDASFAPRLANLLTRKDPVTGVSEFPLLGERLPIPPGVDDRDLRGQAEARARTGGDLPPLELSPLRADGASATFEEAVAALADGAPLWQVGQALWDGHAPQEIAPLPSRPFAAPFEDLRDRADAAAATGRRPAILLVTLGPKADHAARESFAANLFEAGGIETVATGPLTSAEEAAAHVTAAGAQRVCICGSDAAYADLAAPVAAALVAAGARSVFLAGRPGANEAAWRAAGVGQFVYIGCPVVDVLSDLLTSEGA